MIDKKTSTRINCLIYMIRGNCIDWKFSKLPCLRSSFAVPYGYNISNITINFQTVHIIQLLLSTCLFCCCFFCASTEYLPFILLFVVYVCIFNLIQCFCTWKGDPPARISHSYNINISYVMMDGKKMEQNWNWLHWNN